MFKIREKKLRTFFSSVTGELTRTFTKPDIRKVSFLHSKTNDVYLTLKTNIIEIQPDFQNKSIVESSDFKKLSVAQTVVSCGKYLLGDIPRVIPSYSLDEIPKRTLIKLINQFYKKTSVSLKKVSVISVYLNVPFNSEEKFSFEKDGLYLYGNLSHISETYNIVVYKNEDETENKVAVIPC